MAVIEKITGFDEGGLLGYVRANDVHPDSRGNVRETYRTSDVPECPPVKQMVRSKSKAGVLRAMHAHKKQWDIWHFVKGAAYVQLYEPFTGDNYAFVLTAGSTLYIPPGVAHGFESMTPCVLTYLLTEEYDGTDEFGFDAFDPDFPGSRLWSPDLIRSDRDKNAPSLAEFKANW